VKRLAFPLALLCGFAVADEQQIRDFIANDEWFHFTDTASGGKVFTKGVVRLDPGRFQLWFKVEKPQPKECRKEPFFRSPMDSALCDDKEAHDLGESLNLFEMNCENRTGRIVQATYYNFNNDILDSFEEPDAPWTRQVPDSIGEGFISYFCEGE